ncbi:uncharacterized protein G2W53_035051 [Senna tora]|uniref:Uncharacterized protein n=1 Tax=Senna tora TaxID=362788 RepID=A0A834W4K4_9FABA|nr:uncharacterized protein G2W53_035051 [Senna tora]
MEVENHRRRSVTTGGPPESELRNMETPNKPFP